MQAFFLFASNARNYNQMSCPRANLLLMVPQLLYFLHVNVVILPPSTTSTPSFLKLFCSANLTCKRGLSLESHTFNHPPQPSISLYPPPGPCRAPPASGRADIAGWLNTASSPPDSSPCPPRVFPLHRPFPLTALTTRIIKMKTVRQFHPLFITPAQPPPRPRCQGGLSDF